MKKPPHIAYVISRFPLLSETFILRELVFLKSHDWPLDVYTIQRLASNVRHPEAADIEASVHTVGRLDFSTLQTNACVFRRSPATYLRLFARTIAGNAPSPDFLRKAVYLFPAAIAMAERMRTTGVQHIHAHYGTHPTLAAMLAAELLGIGYSFTAHAHDIYVDATMLPEKIRRARFVATISSYNRDLLVRMAGARYADRIHVVRCGVDPEAYPFEIRGNQSGSRSILAVASLQEYKGLRFLIEACALLRRQAPDLPFRCEIAGEGPLRQELEQRITNLGLTGHVVLLGPRDQGAVRSLLARADAFVLPSVVAKNGQMEGIPVALMEAMASGVPVVATALSGVPELVRPGDTGLLVPPGNPAAISAALQTCWHDPDGASARASRGRHLVEDEYNLGTNVPKLMSLFSDTVQRSTVSPLVNRSPLASHQF